MIFSFDELLGSFKITFRKLKVTFKKMPIQFYLHLFFSLVGQKSTLRSLNLYSNKIT
jgi:hypothetical protein